MTAPRRPRTPAAARRGRRRRPHPLLQGDRPYFLALLVLLALLALMAVGPLQSFTAAATRVDELAARRAALQSAVDELEAERARLQDPEELELLAREELGMVMPGEVPYVVVTPEPGLDDVHPPPLAVADDGRAWYQRLWDRVAALF